MEIINSNAFYMIVKGQRRQLAIRIKEFSHKTSRGEEGSLLDLTIAVKTNGCKQILIGSVKMDYKSFARF